MSMGPTMDMAIIRETFTRTIAASEMFNLDESFRNELKDKLARLLPYQIGKRGQLQEWIYDFKEWEPQHRHFSHLYGFHPSDQITPTNTGTVQCSPQNTRTAGRLGFRLVDGLENKLLGTLVRRQPRLQDHRQPVQSCRIRKQCT